MDKTYERYKAARNAACQTLLDCGVSSLPVDLGAVAKHYDVQIVPLSKCTLTQLLAADVISGDGWSTGVFMVSTHWNEGCWLSLIHSQAARVAAKNMIEEQQHENYSHPCFYFRCCNCPYWVLTV